MATSDSPQSGIYIQQHTGRNASMYVDAGSVLNLAAGTLAGALATGTIDLGAHLFAARELSSAENFASGTSAPAYFWGGMLYNESTPALALNTTLDETASVFWIGGNVDAIKLPPVALPSDLSTAGPMTIELYGETVGTASAADAIQSVQSKIWMGIGGTVLGTTQPSFTSTPSWQGTAVASGSLTTDVMNIILLPQAHANRGIRVYGARARYRRG